MTMLPLANIFQPLIDVFQAVLTFFHNSIGIPWGWSIVVLTIAVRVVLAPLMLKQFHSMQKLQKLQPELKALQNKYKADKERQQQELMKFYRENNVNPLGSCLPLVAQLPVMISLFYMLRQSLRADVCPSVQPHHIVKGLSVINKAAVVPCGPHNGANFLFIGDLTNKATGLTLIVLIVVYVGTQLASTMLMSTPTMDRTQRQLMMFMPLFFVIFVISFPAGVIVYWITTNAWTMAQQYVFRRRLGTAGPALAGAGPAGDAVDASASGANDGGSKTQGVAGGLGNLLRGRLKAEEEPAAVATGGRVARTGASQNRAGTTPPRPPRKKKKRSGRRR